MYNVLIIEDNIVQSHMIANYISKKFSNIRIYSMTTTGREAIKIIDKGLIDIILLDLLLPDISGIEILNYICNNYYQKYNNSIIIVTAEMNLLAKVVNKPNVFDYVSKIDGMNKIAESLKELLKVKDVEKKGENKKEQINNELHKLSYNFSYVGTKYLADCIYEVYLTNEIYDINLKRKIYPIVAKKNNKKINNIKTNIARSTNNMYNDCPEKNLRSYFGYNIMEKPKIKDIIIRVIENI